MKISTSILSSKDRIKDIEKLNHTNTSYIHVDVMDGKFVDNSDLEDIKMINAINTVSKYPMDIHLMVDNPEEYIKQYHDMNIEFITFHVEIGKNKDKIIDTIHEMGYKVGLAIKPKTDIKELEPYLDKVDLILIMSVEPGRGGQAFIPDTEKRIQDIKKIIGKRKIILEVDGGINDKTIDKVSGVDIAVSGSYIINSDNYCKRVESLIKHSKEGGFLKKVISCLTLKK